MIPFGESDPRILIGIGILVTNSRPTRIHGTLLRDKPPDILSSSYSPPNLCSSKPFSFFLSFPKLSTSASVSLSPKPQAPKPKSIENFENGIMTVTETDVLIVGGGPVGLLTGTYSYITPYRDMGYTQHMHT